MPTRLRSRCLPVLTSAFLAVAPATASADWLIAGYIGAAHTPNTTLHVTPNNGTTVDLSGVEFEGRAFKSPPYYGYRISWIPDSAGGGTRSRLGVEAEFTHAKTIAIDTRSAALTAFEQSHGLNFVLGNVALRWPPFCAGRCVGVARIGAGVTLPHVEATYLGQRAESYQFGGPAAQAGLGLEIAAAGGLTVVGDARVTVTHVNDDLPGAALSASFTSWHISAGVGWKFR